MNNMNSTISKEAIGDLPLCQFDGEIILVDKPEDVEQAVEQLLKEKVIGFDTETRPSFKKGSMNSTSLLQLSTSQKAYLFRINKTGLTPELVKLLESRKVIKVGVGIRDDLKGLNLIATFKPGKFVELQDMAKSFGIDVLSLKALAGLLLNVRVSKRQRLSNWEADTLTRAQQEYAAIDAWIALRLFEELMRQDPEYKFKTVIYRN
jgi:ribonuclease D